MLDYVTFDVSRITCMADWIEIEIVINLLVILNNFITVTLMYFIVHWIGLCTEIIVLLLYMDI